MCRDWSEPKVTPLCSDLRDKVADKNKWNCLAFLILSR